MITSRGRFLFMIEPFLFMLSREWIHRKRLANHTLVFVILFCYIPLLYGSLYLYKIEVEYIYFAYIIPAILLMLVRVLIIGLWFEMFCNSIRVKDSIRVLSISGVTATIFKYMAFYLFYNQLSLTNDTNYFLYVNAVTFVAIIASCFIWNTKPVSKQVGLQIKFKFKWISARNLFLIFNMSLLPIMQDDFNTLSQYDNIIKREELMVLLFLVIIFLLCAFLLNSETIHVLSILIISFSLVNVILGGFVWLSTILVVIDCFYIYTLLHKWYALNANYCMIYCIYIYAISDVLKGMGMFGYNKFLLALVFSISTVILGFTDANQGQFM